MEGLGVLVKPLEDGFYHQSCGQQEEKCQKQIWIEKVRQAAESGSSLPISALAASFSFSCSGSSWRVPQLWYQGCIIDRTELEGWFVYRLLLGRWWRQTSEGPPVWPSCWRAVKAALPCLPCFLVSGNTLVSSLSLCHFLKPPSAVKYEKVLAVVGWVTHKTCWAEPRFASRL